MEKENKCIICNKKGYYSSILGKSVCKKHFDIIWDKANREWKKKN